jgi:hypothetical protein
MQVYNANPGDCVAMMGGPPDWEPRTVINGKTIRKIPHHQTPKGTGTYGPVNVITGGSTHPARLWHAQKLT